MTSTAQVAPIPDPYCLMTGGFQNLRVRMQQTNCHWHERLPLAFNGSTTGTKDINLNTLELNRRYQLARFSRSWPSRIDARINRVVQCRDALARKQVELRLHREGLLSCTVNPWHAALHAWQIDIDGNVNSWGLLWKLLSGSCILRVESPRRQWFHHRLQPWEHLVPVQADQRSRCTAQLSQQSQGMCSHRPAGQALALQVVDEIRMISPARGALRTAWM